MNIALQLESLKKRKRDDDETITKSVSRTLPLATKYAFEKQHNNNNNKRPRRFVCLAKRVQRVAERDARQASDSITNSLILETWEHQLLEGNPLVKQECSGDRLVKRINEALRYLDQNGFERSSQQRLFHRAFMQASYEQLYGNELHKNLVRLLEEDGISEMRTEVAITTPRRFGKTFSIALWCACTLVLMNGHDSSIYSTSARVSKMLLQTTLRFVYMLQEKFGGKIIAIDKNEYVEFLTNDGHVNSFHAYPAKSETLRGTGSKRKAGTVVLEEAAFINPEVTTSIVAPTLTRDNVNLFCISTINSDDVVMKGFVDAKYPDGRSVMRVLNFSLVCKECRATGRVDTCRHLMGELPHWSSSAQHGKLALLMKNSQETLQREIKGMDISERTKCMFNAQSIKALRDDALSVISWQRIGVQRRIFIVVDPDAGGERSAMALVSFVVLLDKMVVLGGEEIGNSTIEARHDALHAHIQKLRSIREYAGCQIVFCAEENLGWEASHMSNYLREKRLPNVIIMCEAKNDKDGWHTDAGTKERAALRMSQILNERRLKFSDRMIRVQRQNAENDEKQLRENMINQLQQFMRIVKPVKNLWDKEKVEYSGKLSGRDDLAMALQMSLLIYERFVQRSDKYLTSSPQLV